MIINHFITISGFVKKAADLFKGIVGSGDYHSEMNGEHYAVRSENRFQELYPQMAISTSTAPNKIYCFNCFYITVYSISLLIVSLIVLLIVLLII